MTDWDIVTGIGITALGAAASRAIESCRPDSLVTDQYAAAFIHAAHPPAPLVLEFKDLVLREQNARPRRERHLVPCDL
jgi:O-methyltransferase involved in polyketide biosynthesis